MMKLKGKGMMWMRFFHILCAGIWFGSVVGIFGLSIVCFFYSTENQFLSYSPLIMILYKNIVMPFALLTIIQGIIYGLITHWGFFKFKWITHKWILVIATILCTGPGAITQVFAVQQKVLDSGFSGRFSDGGQVLLWISAQIVLMIIMIGYSVFKPFKNQRKTK